MTHQKDAVAFSNKGLCFLVLDTFCSFINAVSRFFKLPSEFLFPNANLPVQKNFGPLFSSGNIECRLMPVLLIGKCPGF